MNNGKNRQEFMFNVTKWLLGLFFMFTIGAVYFILRFTVIPMREDIGDIKKATQDIDKRVTAIEGFIHMYDYSGTVSPMPDVSAVSQPKTYTNLLDSLYIAAEPRYKFKE